MINAIFDRCVQILVFAAGQLGISYKAINVWAFVILWPIFTLVLIGVVIVQHVRIRRLEKRMEENKRKTQITFKWNHKRQGNLALVIPCRSGDLLIL